MRFVEIALREGFLSREQLGDAEKIQREKPDWHLIDILAFLGHLDDDRIKKVEEIERREDSNAESREFAIDGAFLKQEPAESKVPETRVRRGIPGKPNSNVPSDDFFHLTAGIRFGRYRILEELGRGGMGRVYKAYDSKLDRVVALKVLISGGSASQKEVERFLREARATAKLRHPHIVSLHDIGNEQGLNYFTMDFLEGLSLKAFLEKSSATLPQIANIMIKVGKAVHYAHTQEIIHRDIKPSNIMIDIYQEPKIMDFGLAKMVSSNDNLSKTGDLLGTPAYMSPEQSESRTIDNRTDVYSLGVTLYEALTGSPPFQGKSYVDILYQIVHKDPPLLRKRNRDIPPDLEAICLKCIEKKTAKRYQSALLFVQDLENFLARRSVSAKLPTPWTRLQKMLTGRRSLPVIMMALSLFGLVAGGYGLVGWRIAESGWQEVCELRESENRESRMLLSRIALARASEAFQAREWKRCGVFAGTALEYLRGLRGVDVDFMKSRAEGLVKSSVTSLGISEPVPLSWENDLRESPCAATEALFGMKVNESFSLEPLRQ